MTAIFPGSFDPVTFGHMDIIRRAAQITDRLIVAVFVNAAKRPLFTMEERVNLLRGLTEDLPNIIIDSFSGLLAEYARIENADVIIRGVRNPADLAYETGMAQINRSLGKGLETLFLPAEPGLAHISGSAVRQIAAILYRDGLDDAGLDAMVAPSVKEALKRSM